MNTTLKQAIRELNKGGNTNLDIIAELIKNPEFSQISYDELCVAVKRTCNTDPKLHILDVKIEDHSIKAFWLGKWRPLRYYGTKLAPGKRPSAKIMADAERVFRMNSGMSPDHTIEWNWI
jgi:hypothetical protein